VARSEAEQTVDLAKKSASARKKACATIRDDAGPSGIEKKPKPLEQADENKNNPGSLAPKTSHS